MSIKFCIRFQQKIKNCEIQVPYQIQSLFEVSYEAIRNSRPVSSIELKLRMNEFCISFQPKKKSFDG